MNTIERIRKALEESKARSAWARGVKEYALELFEAVEWSVEGGYIDAEDIADLKHLDTTLLNGASDWYDFSWGGCSLIYDRDIAARLCTPTELKRTDNGRRDPNSSEHWLDTQARALFQAEMLIKQAIIETLEGAC